MACPTCDHTMHNIGRNGMAENIFWCPRCGTLRTHKDTRPTLPTMVAAMFAELFCYQGAAPLLAPDDFYSLARRIGVLRGCGLPDERK